MDSEQIRGERRRLLHAIERAEETLRVMRRAVSGGTFQAQPTRADAQSVLEAAGVVALTDARLELLESLERVARGEQCARCGLVPEANR